jgi:hypothetical protein
VRLGMVRARPGDPGVSDKPPRFVAKVEVEDRPE